MVQTCHVQLPPVPRLDGPGAAPQCQTQMLFSTLRRGCPRRQGYEMCFGGGEPSTRLGAETSAQQVAAGPILSFSMPQGLLLRHLTAHSTLQQDKRALSPGNSWLSYFSFRPHLLVGAVVTSQAGHDIQDAFFRSPRAKPNLPLQLCREKCRGKSEKLGSCWRGIEVCLGNCLLLPRALLPILKQGKASLDPRRCEETSVSWTGVFRHSRVLYQDGGRQLLVFSLCKYKLRSLHAGSAFARA